MPRSKRNKLVSLTKTSSKGKDLKAKLIETIRQHVDEYDRMFVLSYQNMRASRFKDIRMDWKESKIYLGKLSIAQVALGRNAEEEYMDNLSRVSELLHGNMGLLFTSRAKKEVMKYFKNISMPEYANAGFIPTETIVLEPCMLSEQFPTIQPVMVDHLRKLGLVVEVVNGALELKSSYAVATEGVPLTPEQAKVLEHIKRPLDVFTVKLVSHWNKAKGSFEEL